MPSADKKLQLEDYWIAQLGGVGGPPPLELPTDRPRPMQLSTTARGSSDEVSLPHELIARLAKVAQQAACDVPTVLLSAFQMLLARYSQQEAFCVGAVLPRTPEVSNNPLPIMGEFSGDPSVSELLARAQQMVERAWQHDIVFEDLASNFTVSDKSRAVIFQAVFAMQNSGAS